MAATRAAFLSALSTGASLEATLASLHSSQALRFADADPRALREWGAAVGALGGSGGGGGSGGKLAAACVLGATARDACAAACAAGAGGWVAALLPLLRRSEPPAVRAMAALSLADALAACGACAGGAASCGVDVPAALKPLVPAICALAEAGGAAHAVAALACLGAVARALCGSLRPHVFALERACCAAMRAAAPPAVRAAAAQALASLAHCIGSEQWEGLLARATASLRHAADALLRRAPAPACAASAERLPMEELPAAAAGVAALTVGPSMTHTPTGGPYRRPTARAANGARAAAALTQAVDLGVLLGALLGCRSPGAVRVPTASLLQLLYGILRESSKPSGEPGAAEANAALAELHAVALRLLSALAATLRSALFPHAATIGELLAHCARRQTDGPVALRGQRLRCEVYAAATACYAALGCALEGELAEALFAMVLQDLMPVALLKGAAKPSRKRNCVQVEESAATPQTLAAQLAACRSLDALFESCASLPAQSREQANVLVAQVLHRDAVAAELRRAAYSVLCSSLISASRDGTSDRLPQSVHILRAGCSDADTHVRAACTRAIHVCAVMLHPDRRPSLPARPRMPQSDAGHAAAAGSRYAAELPPSGARSGQDAAAPPLASGLAHVAVGPAPAQQPAPLAPAARTAALAVVSFEPRAARAAAPAKAETVAATGAPARVESAANGAAAGVGAAAAGDAYAIDDAPATSSDEET